MNGTDRLKVVLFALTGFGNEVLKTLLEDTRVEVGAVFTVKYENPFPYYREQQLGDLCDERQVPCYFDVKVSDGEGINLLREYAPDLIIVATFMQILRENVLHLPKLGVVNFHPSLLPRYRGPCPSNAALLNDEMNTGMTAHYVTKGLDEGNILIQRKTSISKTDNDGQLRKKLAKLAGKMIRELIDMFVGFNRPLGTPQDHSQATFAPKPALGDGYLEAAPNIDTIRNKVRALNPFPGTSILIGDRRVAVDKFELLPSSRPDGLHESNISIDLVINSQAIRLYKKAG